MTRYIFVTGGVVSGLGKGITAASLGRLLKARGYRVTMQKLDPYLNVDPGTMNPIQHGEVFVTEDGTETDLDLGHYERFIDENLNFNSNVTSGKIYWSVLNKERHGDYGGGTVQVIPHVTNEIKSRFYTGQPFGTLAPQEKLCLQKKCPAQRLPRFQTKICPKSPSLRSAVQSGTLNHSPFMKLSASSCRKNRREPAV